MDLMMRTMSSALLAPPGAPKGMLVFDIELLAIR